MPERKIYLKYAYAGLLFLTGATMVGCNVFGQPGENSPQLPGKYDTYTELGNTPLKGRSRFSLGAGEIDIRNYSNFKLDPEKAGSIFTLMHNLPVLIGEGEYRLNPTDSKLFYILPRKPKYYRLTLVGQKIPFPNWKPTKMSDTAFTRLFLPESLAASFIRVTNANSARKISSINPDDPTVSLATESCQALVGTVGSPEKDPSIQTPEEKIMQELFCNGLGIAVGFKSIDFDYPKYKEISDTATLSLPGNNKTLPSYQLPLSAYSRIPDLKNLFSD